MLLINDLHVSYGGIKALRGITLRIEDNKIVTLIGANGAGKSSTLRSIMNLVKKESGKVYFDDEDITNFKTMDIVKKGNVGWPVNVLHHAPTEETIMESLITGPYGRCVYHCDNDVVDHQVVNLLLEGGTTVSFTMCAFTVDCAREIRIMGTMGEIFGDFHNNTISVMPFGKDAYDIDINQLTSDFSGHGGGDARMVEEFLRLLNGEPVSESITIINHSIESHLVALAAERSRLNNGESLIL